MIMCFLVTIFDRPPGFRFGSDLEKHQGTDVAGLWFREGGQYDGLQVILEQRGAVRRMWRG